jgi:hypothetical protein
VIAMNSVVRAGAAVFAVLALAACGGGAPKCIAVPEPVAVAPLPTPVLVQPAPGATGVPTTGLQVAIRFGIDGELLRLVDQNGVTLFGGLFERQVFPAVGPPQYDHVAAAPQLAPHTSYTVFADGSVPAFGCDPAHPFSFSIGTFTTQ